MTIWTRDFAADPLGAGIPAGWADAGFTASDGTAQPVTCEVVDHAGSRCAWFKTGWNPHAAAIWNGPESPGGTLGDFEVLTRFQYSFAFSDGYTASPNYGYLPVGRVTPQGAYGTDGEYITSHLRNQNGSGTEDYHGRYWNGTGYTHDGGTELTAQQTLTNFPISADVWYLSRTQIQGDTIRTRHWVDGDPEPTTWKTWTGVQTNYPAAGYIGYAPDSWNCGPVISYISVATLDEVGGAPEPPAASTSSPNVTITSEAQVAVNAAALTNYVEIDGATTLTTTMDGAFSVTVAPVAVPTSIGGGVSAVERPITFKDIDRVSVRMPKPTSYDRFGRPTG